MKVITYMTENSTKNAPEVSSSEQSSLNLAPIQIVTDAERIKILMDKTRLKILHLLREGIPEGGKRRHELTVRELAELLGISTPQSLYHHVDLLVEHGFLYPAREVKKKRSRITYYARTSPVFLIVNSVGEIPEYDEGIGQFARMFVESLDIELTPEEMDRLVNLIVKYDQREAQVLARYAPLITMKDEQETWRKGLWLFTKLIMFSDDEGKKIAEEIVALIKPKLDKKLAELS